MARIRTIKPEFFTSLTVANLPIEARLTFVGLWTHVDDEGRCVDDARLIKAAVWPLDDRVSADVERDLQILSEASLIVRYEVGGRSFLTVRSWREHQKINRPTKSKLPPPPDRPPVAPPPAKTPAQDANHGALTEDSGQERNREQGTGNREVPSGAAASRPRRDEPVDAEIVDERPPLRSVPDAPAVKPQPPTTTAELIADWIDHCKRRPPGQLIGRVGKEVKRLIEEDRIDPAAVREGLARWAERDISPAVLPSVVNEVINPGRGRGTPPRRSTTDDRVAAGLALAAKYDALAAGQQHAIEGASA